MKLDAERIAAALELPVYVYDTLDSTSSECRRRLAAGEQRCLVLAETQTLGRGRRDRSFFSPRGGLYMSLAMEAMPDVTGLTCRAAVETAEAVDKLTGLQCGIKWVNDLMLNGKKVCGILAEAVGNSVILGIGVNLTPAVLPRELEQLAGFLDCGDLREPLAEELVRRLMRPRERADYMAEYRRRCVMQGKMLHCRVGGREFDALAVDVDADGGLVVLGPEGRETLTFGEVRLIR